jgi:serine/threonine protein phosphatase PrpC
MGLLTIGAFARASRLSPKALRLYDELGLLPPAHVDPVTGYRFYDPDQLEQARLVAWLRQLGMPLTQIQAVCELDPGAAAAEISAFWARVEADTAARRDLAAFLIGHLSDRDAQPADAASSLEIRYAVRSDVGLVRPGNMDAAYASARLLAVADGFGAGGAPASRAAIESLMAVTENTRLPAGDLLNALQDAVATANQVIGGIAESGETDQVAGTTLTGMVWTGSQLALVHIGDSRAYLLRDSELFQITHDHTVVQAMVDSGRLSPAEATSHPQRAMLLRALDGRAPATAEVGLHDARPGDRFLLCSDGLSAVLTDSEIRRVVTTVADPTQTVSDLVDLVRAAGAPDNVSCVVADVVGTRQ